MAVTGPAVQRNEAFTRMVAAYQGAIRRMCFLYLMDPALAEDAVQETFLKAYRRMDTFRADSRERTWLMSIAINTCRDMNRSAWLRHTEKRVTPEELPIPVDAVDEDAIALAEAIRRLPGKHRDAILLYYYQDMTIQETAKALHAAPSTIMKRLTQARDMLRDLLSDQPPSEGRHPHGR